MKSSQEDIDQLVKAARKGDRHAFDKLVLIFQDQLMNTAYYFSRNRDDAEDIVQEAFLRAYRSITGFKSESSFKTWMTRILINTCRTHRARSRAIKRSAKVISLTDAGDSENSDMLPLPASHADDNPQALLMRKEMDGAIHSAIGSLDDDSRAVLVLRDLAGESYETIVKILGIPLGTAKSRIHRARLAIQQKLQSGGFIETKRL